jgi:hypothetical protein
VPARVSMVSRCCRDSAPVARRCGTVRLIADDQRLAAIGADGVLHATRSRALKSPTDSPI